MTLDDSASQQLEDDAHNAVRAAGFAFTEALWGGHSLVKAWPLTDPELRRCMAQAWLYGQEDTARRSGFEPDDVVEAFTADQPDHPLWETFEALQLPDLLEWKPGVHEWAVTAHSNPVALDVELIYMVPPTEDGIVSDTSVYLPLVMRYDPVAGWRVLNFLSDGRPEPGWPPRL